MDEPILKLFLVDDEDSVRVPLAHYLKAEPHHYEVTDVPDFEQAAQVLDERKGNFDVALIDEVLGEGPSGLEILRYIKSNYSEIEVILFTGWGLKSGEEVRHIGAYSYIAKPFDVEQLALTIYNAAERKRIQREHRYMEELVKASQSLTQTTRLDEQLEIIWNFVREHLATPTCFVALYDSQTDHLHFPLSYDEGELDPLPDLTLGAEPASWGVAGFVIKTGQEQVWSSWAQAEKDWQALGIKSHLSPKGPSESGICLPLSTTAKCLGALSVQSYQPAAFDEALLNAVRALGHQVAVTLENSYLVTETKQKALNLEKLQNLAIAINSTLDLKEVLIQTCQAAVELTGIDHSGVVLFDPDLSKGSVLAEYPIDKQISGQMVPVRGVTAEELLVFHQETLNIPDVASDDSLGPIRETLMNYGIRSILIVPVIFNGKVVASFSLDAIQAHRNFSQSEIEICQSLANQAAVAIRNARLYKETREGREYLEALYQATTEIISPRNPDDVLQNVVETVCHRTSAWRAVILLIDESKVPRVLTSFGFNHSLALAKNIRSEGISIQVVRSGESRFIPDIQAEAEGVNPAMIAQGTRAAACLPLTLQSKNIGVLWVQFREARAFSETERQALQLYANQSAVAYDNSRHMHQLDQLRESAEAMAGVEEPKQVLQKIVEGAKRVLEADITLIWSYDLHREDGVFIPEESVAEGISAESLEKFRLEQLHADRMTRHILDHGYLKVTDLCAAVEMETPTRIFLEDLGVKSFHSIRLDVAGEPLGVLHVIYKTNRDFQKEERQILEHFANHAALTLKKARLLKQVKRAHEAARVVSAVTTIGKLENTLREIVSGAKDVLDCDIVTIYTFDEKIQKFVHFEGTGFGERSSLRHPQEVAPDSSLWRVINMEEPYYPAEDVSKDRLLQGGFVRSEKVYSALGIQLRFEGKRVGVMFINYRNPHRFTQDEINDALQFGNQAAIAIHNVQLHEKTKRQAEQLAGLYQAGKEVTSLLTISEILQRIAEHAWSLVGRRITYTIIRLIEGGTAKVVAAYPSQELTQQYTAITEIDFTTGVAGRIGVTGRAILTGCPQMVNDVDIDDDYIHSYPNIHSELAVPIKLGKKVIGVINVDSPELRAFDEDDQQTLTSLASYAAIAISNAQLLERTKAQAEASRGLYEAGKAITRTLAVDEVLTHIAEQALHIVHADAQAGSFSHVALLDGNKLSFIAGFPLEILKDLQQNIGEIDLQGDVHKGIAGYAVLTGRPQKVDEVVGNPTYIPLRAGINIHSQLSVPLKIGESMIGVLSIESPKNAAFSDEDVKNIESLAAPAAVAIQNARQFGKTERALAARTALAWTGMISSTWRHTIDKHAITIREQIALLRDDLRKVTRDDSMENRLEMMERLANQILKKPLTAPLSAEESVGSIRVNEFIRERTGQLWVHQPYKEVDLELHLELENSATVRISIEWLRRALDILIDNAIDAMAERVERKIVIWSRQADHKVEIFVGDSGRGIHPDLRLRLFHEPIAKPKEAKGLGIGLLFAQMIVETYGGEIRIKETGTQGTTMAVRLPLES